MANFRTHVTVSTVLGIGYTGVGALKGLPVESALVAGGLCGVAGMLPDIDSDSGIPLRETMGFSAAVVPMLMMDRFQDLGLNYEQIVLAGGMTYLFVRFALTRLIARYTVHRGMWHSIPAVLIFTGIAFLVSGSENLQLRYFKAGGVMIGSLSHLLMDELNSIEWSRGRWRFKKSFGTALKLWGKDWWANFSTYGKLALVGVLILSEPAIMEEYGNLSPVVVDHRAWRDQLRGDPNAGEAIVINGLPTTPTDKPYERPVDENGDPIPLSEQPPEIRRDRTIYDTAKRVFKRWFD
ncbi:MAG: metal-dependent hydrolase [Lacipirellulaceae bacterium]